jgi:hypothetical protein
VQTIGQAIALDEIELYAPAPVLSIEQPAGTPLTTTHRSVVAWGRNDTFQTGVPSVATYARAIAAGEGHSIAIAGYITPADGNPLIGSLVSWGSHVESVYNDLVYIAAGYDETILASEVNGINNLRPYYGSNLVPKTVSTAQIKSLAAGRRHSVALKKDGTVTANAMCPSAWWMSSPSQHRTTTRWR